jgi:DNA end-binding protein Ku
MACPYWSGRVQISLVSFGVQLYVATEAKSQISFNQISRSTGDSTKKPAASVRPEPKKGIGLVKSSSKPVTKRKSA